LNSLELYLLRFLTGIFVFLNMCVNLAVHVLQRKIKVPQPAAGL
jgi:hypothetical protein